MNSMIENFFYVDLYSHLLMNINLRFMSPVYLDIEGFIFALIWKSYIDTWEYKLFVILYDSFPFWLFLLNLCKEIVMSKIVSLSHPHK